MEKCLSNVLEVQISLSVNYQKKKMICIINNVSLIFFYFIKSESQSNLKFSVDMKCRILHEHLISYLRFFFFSFSFFICLTSLKIEYFGNINTKRLNFQILMVKQAESDNKLYWVFIFTRCIHTNED